MPVRYTMKLTGLEDYLERIAQAGQDVNKAAAKAVQAGGVVVLDAMKRRVPVLTGNLKNHLDCTDAAINGNVISVEVGIRSDSDENTAIYGNVQEYGSSSNKAQPYIRPGFDESKGKVTKAEKNVLKGWGIL